MTDLNKRTKELLAKVGLDDFPEAFTPEQSLEMLVRVIDTGIRNSDSPNFFKEINVVGGVFTFTMHDKVNSTFKVMIEPTEAV